MMFSNGLKETGMKNTALIFIRSRIMLVPKLFLIVSVCFSFLVFLVSCQDLSSLPKSSVSSEERNIYEHNFGRENASQQNTMEWVVDFRDLQSWGRSRGLILLPDLPLKNLQDFEAQLIPPYGYSFTLSAPRKSDVFLYLDIAVYKPQNKKNFTAVRKMVWLEVLVNGNQVGLVYQGGNSFLSSPLRFKIPRTYLLSQKMKIKLLPSPVNSHFAIWDSFVGPSAEL